MIVAGQLSVDDRRLPIDEEGFPTMLFQSAIDNRLSAIPALFTPRI